MADVPGRVIQMAGTVRVGGAFIDRGVLSSIQAASRKAGIDFAFMLAKARRESGFQADARNATSSAQGLYQFTHQTWMEQIKRHGPEHGLGELAERITKRPGGGYQADSQETLDRILALRHDPHLSAAMAAEFAADNRRLLTRALGRDVGGTDLYLAHFLGPGGAIDFLRALERNPDTCAADVVPAAARANPSIFRSADGTPRTLRDVYAVVELGIGGAMRRFAGAAGLAGPVPLPPGVKPTAPEKEDMLLARAPDAAFALTQDDGGRVPLPAGLKPTQPDAEDMGRFADASKPPTPWALKPAPEQMHPDTPDPGTATAVADASPALDEATMLRILAASSVSRPAPAGPDVRALGLHAAQAFGPGPSTTPTVPPDPAMPLDWAGNDRSPEAGDPSQDALIAEALASLTPEEQRVIASVVEAAQAVGAKRGLSMADIAGSALRAFDALAAERDAAGPVAVALADDGLIPAEALPGALAGALAEAPAGALAEEEPVPALDPQTIVADVAPPPAPAAPPASSTTTYSILAVVESFDPEQRLTEIKGQIPGLASAALPPAPDAPAPDKVALSSPQPDEQVVASANATLMGWLRRMMG